MDKPVPKYWKEKYDRSEESRVGKECRARWGTYRRERKQ